MSTVNEDLFFLNINIDLAVCLSLLNTVLDINTFYRLLDGLPPLYTVHSWLGVFVNHMTNWSLHYRPEQGINPTLIHSVYTG